MTEEYGLCSVCGATLTTKRITCIQPMDEVVVLVAGVPAEVCAQCGEQYLAPDTVDAIEQLLGQCQAPEMVKVPLYHYPQATA